MRIRAIETFHCDAGWRPWTFVKISTDSGLIGWSECTTSHGSPRGVEGVVRDLAPLLVGDDPRDVERLYWLMHSRTRQSPGGVASTAIAGIENALIDIKARALDVRACDLFGGPVRERIPLYWSHAATTRIRAAGLVQQPPIRSLDDLGGFGEEVKESGYRAVKTNIGILDDSLTIYMPGFAKSPGWPELNIDSEILKAVEAWISAMRSACGPDIDLIIDLNFNFRLEGLERIVRRLEPYGLLWVELDSYDSTGLGRLRQAVSTPICSGENLYGPSQYRPYLESAAMDVVSVDVAWNGLIRALQIASLANTYDRNVTPHNYNGHLATSISGHFAALVPNLRLVEFDVDDVPWREEVFTGAPLIDDGHLLLPDEAGWGIAVNEDVLKEHRWEAP